MRNQAIQGEKKNQTLWSCILAKLSAAKSTTSLISQKMLRPSQIWEEDHFKVVSRSRSFNAKWYNGYSWLTLVQQQTEPCAIPVRQHRESTISLSEEKKCWASIHNCRIWKKAFFFQKRIELHTECLCWNCQGRREWMLVFNLLNNTKSASGSLKSTLIQIEPLRFLLRQGLCIRGHEQLEGNRIQLPMFRHSE